MKFLKALKDFQITATGGYAIYLLLCTAFVTIAGLLEMVGFLIHFYYLKESGFKTWNDLPLFWRGFFHTAFNLIFIIMLVLFMCIILYFFSLAHQQTQEKGKCDGKPRQEKEEEQENQLKSI
jgi:predicted membrane protein